MVDIEKYISLSNEVFKKIDKDQLIKAIDLIKLKINTNKKIITCGNGGSALTCLLYTSPSPRDAHESRMPSSA